MNTIDGNNSEYDDIIFSVVIPCFNVGNYIETTLKSILNQSFSKFEIILIDDGSTDDFILQVNKFDDPRIKIISQVNSGVSVARNRGICESKGKYIAFLDGDDCWLKDHLELALLYFEGNTNSSWYYVPPKVFFEISENDIHMEVLPKPLMNENDYFTDRIELFPSGVIFRKTTIFQQNEGKIYPEGISYGEDTYAWINYAIQFPRIGHHENRYFLYRLNRPGSATLGFDNIKNNIYIEKMSELYYKYYENKKARIYVRKIINGLCLKYFLLKKKSFKTDEFCSILKKMPTCLGSSYIKIYIFLDSVLFNIFAYPLFFLKWCKSIFIK